MSGGSAGYKFKQINTVIIILVAICLCFLSRFQERWSLLLIICSCSPGLRSHQWLFYCLTCMQSKLYQAGPSGLNTFSFMSNQFFSFSKLSTFLILAFWNSGVRNPHLDNLYNRKVTSICLKQCSLYTVTWQPFNMRKPIQKNPSLFKIKSIRVQAIIWSIQGLGLGVRLSKPLPSPTPFSSTPD